METGHSRRDFLKTLTAGAAACTVLPLLPAVAESLGATAADEVMMYEGAYALSDAVVSTSLADVTELAVRDICRDFAFKFSQDDRVPCGYPRVRIINHKIPNPPPRGVDYDPSYDYTVVHIRIAAAPRSISTARLNELLDADAETIAKTVRENPPLVIDFYEELAEKSLQEAMAQEAKRNRSLRLTKKILGVA